MFKIETGAQRLARREPPANRPRFIESADGRFQDGVNIESFAFTHALAGHPLFELERLAALSKSVLAARTGDQNHYVLCKRAESVANTGKQWENFEPVEQVDEAIKHIMESGSWILITGAEADPEYRALLEQLLDELEALCACPLRSEITWVCASILVGSPNSVTHFHMDSEVNFLFQIHGAKQAHLFDQRDRTILSEEDIETFYAIDGSHVRFREQFQAKARTYNLETGAGVHIPVNAPHWVRNLNDYSVTLSILFYTRASDRRAWAYQANHLLRKLGLNPRPPGSSPLSDTLKAGAMAMLRSRSPRDKQDHLKSGYRFLTAPMRVARRLVSRNAR